MDPSYIVTYTGKKVYPLDPDPDTLCIEDIAHALSNICRFTGHVKTFYSVAQHSVLVSNFCGLPIHGLLHDASEAYLADVASTIKPAFSAFRHAEMILMEAIYAKFNLPDLSKDEKKAIKHTDKAMLKVEWNALMNDTNNYGLGVDLSEVPELHFVLGGCFSPVEAERVFLITFNMLVNKT